VRQELRSAEEVRDAYKRELAGEDPVMVPDLNVNAASVTPSEYNSRIDALRKQLDELLRRYTDQHPDVASTRRLIAQLEEERKKEIEARKQTATQSPSRLSASTNPVFQRIKIALAEAEANVASLRSRVSETEGRLGQLRAAAGRVPQIEAELAQLNRDYEVLQKNYQQLVSRRESASLGEDVNSAGLAEFRIIDPPRVAPNPVFPNRLALIFLVLVAAVGAGLAATFALARVRPTFHAVAALQEFTQRPVLGSVSMLATNADIRRQRLANIAFGGGLAGLLIACGLWVTVVSMSTRV
jgi:polysaccharide chain length determinant protein (PEP-CTERM system associated)